MPLTSFLDASGKVVTFEEALTGKSSLAFSRDILFQIIKQTQTSNYGVSSISVTSLLSCIRKAYLEKLIPFNQTPEKCWYSLRGNLFHKLLDPGSDMDGWLSERRFYKLVDTPNIKCKFCQGLGWAYNRGLEMTEPCSCCAVGGQIDGYDAYNKELLDKKSIGDKGLIYLKEGAKEPHKLQVNIYRWLMSKGITHKLKNTEKKVIKRAGGTFKKIVGPRSWYEVSIPVEKMRIQYFSMMDVVITGGVMTNKTAYLVNPPDKQPTEINREELGSYLKDPVKGPKVTRWELTYSIPDVEIMEENLVTSYVMAKRHDLVDALQKWVIPPMCDEETKKWLCGFCGIKTNCERINELGATHYPSREGD